MNQTDAMFSRDTSIAIGHTGSHLLVSYGNVCDPGISMEGIQDFQGSGPYQSKNVTYTVLR
jgi:hypothetical protein